MFKPTKTTQPAKGSSRDHGFFQNLQSGLKRTREGIVSGITRLAAGETNEDALDELQDHLLMADLGVGVTEQVIENLHTRLRQYPEAGEEAILKLLRRELLLLLKPVSKPLEIIAGQHVPFVILMVGVNGAGKTTTIGKLARRLKDEGAEVMLAAGDTFRAAAVEQLQAWGQRNEVPVIAQKSGADPAAVVYDALQSAQARKADVLIADTAGRLHTQANLMEELKKVRRVLGKLDPSAPHETLLVVDATNGQNALNQAAQFQQAVGVSGLCITKLDGTAKGGIVFALAQRFGIPVRYVGLGERPEDLREFDAREFVDALLALERTEI